MDWVLQEENMKTNNDRKISNCRGDHFILCASTALTSRFAPLCAMKSILGIAP